MFRLLTPAAVLTLMSLGMTAEAQTGPFRIFPGNGYSGPITSRFGPGNHEDGNFQVQYRQLNWQTQVFHNHREAREFEDFKRGQGFEVICRHHGGHVDVQFRRPYWSTYRVVHRDGYAHQLERWLESQGFDARVIHH